MELYILDSYERRRDVVDQFESLIWTERWQDVGDVKLTVMGTQANRELFRPRVKLGLNESKRIMIIDTVEDHEQGDGKKVLKVSGLSSEDILNHRVYKLTMENHDPVSLTGLPAEIARGMFEHIFYDPPALRPWDAIPYLNEVDPSMYPPSTIPEPTETITWEQKPDYLYNAIKSICENYNLGFRLVCDFSPNVTDKLYFEIYTGHNRTSAQSMFTPVIFSTEFGTFKDVTKFTSIADYKNTIYVFSPNSDRQVRNWEAEIRRPEGFDRRILMVEHSVPDGATPAEEYEANLVAGTKALNEHHVEYLIDGVVDQNSNYKYDVDYGLGDIVEFRSSDGFVAYKRVTEQIFASDGEGDRSYPTLVEPVRDLEIATWSSWHLDESVWDDFEVLDEEWDDL